MKVLIFIQQDEKTINRISIEALAGAQKIAQVTDCTLSAVVFGTVPSEISEYSLAETLLVDAPELNSFNPLFFVAAMQQVIESEKPDLIVFGHSYQVRDWVPRLSARINIPFAADCIGFDNEEGFTLIRQIYGGKINSDITVKGQAIMSFQSGAYRTDEIVSGSNTVRNISVDLSAVPQSIRPGERFQEAKGTVDLSRAENIVAIGRGVGKEEKMPIIHEFAEVLGAELGSSRPVVDYGWLPHDRQVGSSGQTVSPNLYIALGLSGAIQHQVGMKGSDNIIAINKDENAPIFEVADFGVVEDMFEILPKLTEAIKEKK